MNTDDAARVVGEAVLFVPAYGGEVAGGSGRLWPGIYRQEGDAMWRPVTEHEWRVATPSERVEWLLPQMRQVIMTGDAEGWPVSLATSGGEGFSPFDVSRGVHKAICQMYHEFKALPEVGTLTVCAAVWVTYVFAGQVPLAPQVAQSALALLMLYGHRYCAKPTNV